MNNWENEDFKKAFAIMAKNICIKEDRCWECPFGIEKENGEYQCVFKVAPYKFKFKDD